MSRAGPADDGFARLERAESPPSPFRAGRIPAARELRGNGRKVNWRASLWLR